MAPSEAELADFKDKLGELTASDEELRELYDIARDRRMTRLTLARLEWLMRSDDKPTVYEP